MALMKIKSTHPESQGPYVVIEEADYNPAIHKPYEEAPQPRAAVSRAAGAPKREAQEVTKEE